MKCSLSENTEVNKREKWGGIEYAAPKKCKADETVEQTNTSSQTETENIVINYKLQYLKFKEPLKNM